MPSQTLHPVAGRATAAPPRRLSIERPTLSVEMLVLLAAVFLLATGNGPFWRAALAGRDPAAAATWQFAGGVFAALAALYTLVIGLVATRHSVRPVLSLAVLVTAFASYYMERYTIYFDREMLRNVLATNPGEARDLLSWGLAAHVGVFGVLPVLLVWWPRLKRRSLGRAAAVRSAWLAGAVLAVVAGLLPVFADVASLMRNQREVRHLITPGNIVASLSSNAFGRGKRPAGPRAAVGPDARLGAAWSGRKRPVLFVLVVGETARAENFSLNGYARETNPELARRDIVNFSGVTACGTSTEVSLPCMFSPFGRADYNEGKIRGHESLLHVLARAGFQVLWRDNQSGCKGVCDGLPSEALAGAKVESLCAEGQCLDEILLHGMEGIAQDANGNLFVVMHQMGSHGPAYFKRYPAVFKHFAPACEDAELHHCAPAEIRNAYDNSLRYTDHFLARVVDFLGRAQTRYDTAMLYVSDHGESLGESGLYLHGVPYAIAPRVQTQVPMVVWLSPAFRQSFGVDQECLRSRAAQPASHDNLFHSVLGLLDVQTGAYQRVRDLFAPCRNSAPDGGGLRLAETAR
ncbi:MAG: phosphoethanolamine--lipid A transferase [Comamonadaceae bacterium]|nr:MAG: phosphoethanolamine--lipid A transferase [Comamonadaceae bacterium]